MSCVEGGLRYQAGTVTVSSLRVEQVVYDRLGEDGSRLQLRHHPKEPWVHCLDLEVVAVPAAARKMCSNVS